jgi:hypothetical protein
VPGESGKHDLGLAAIPGVDDAAAGTVQKRQFLEFRIALAFDGKQPRGVEHGGGGSERA